MNSHQRRKLRRGHVLRMFSRRFAKLFDQGDTFLSYMSKRTEAFDGGRVIAENFIYRGNSYPTS